MAFEALSDPLRVELKGFDATHQIENVLFQNVKVNGRPLVPEQVKTNSFVEGLKVR